MDDEGSSYDFVSNKPVTHKRLFRRFGTVFILAVALIYIITFATLLYNAAYPHTAQPSCVALTTIPGEPIKYVTPCNNGH